MIPAQDPEHQPTERDWQAERREFAAEARDRAAEERELNAQVRQRESEQRQLDADMRETALDSDSWDSREQARLARKQASGQRAEAAANRERARAARDAARFRHPLAARFADIAEHLFAAGSAEEVLARIVRVSVDVLEDAELASVTLLAPGGQLTTPAYTDPLALRIDEIQYRTRQGPCLAVASNPKLAYVAVSDVCRHPGWSIFGPMVAELGVRAVLAVGLLPGSLGTRRPWFGALNMYALRPGSFDEHSLDIALILAAQASGALASATEAGQLRQALVSRDVIGQAKGILMERRKLTADQAFDVLREASQRLNVKLADLAARIAETGEVPPGALPDSGAGARSAG